MKKSLLLLLVVPTASLAEDPFQCVDPDVASAFLGCAAQSQPVYSTSLPPDFPAPPLPSQFELIGSRTGDSEVMVVYKTAQDADAALASSLDVFIGHGWKNVTHGIAAPHGGFQTQAMPAMATICREAAPVTMNILATERSGGTFVSLSVYDQAQTHSCAELASAFSAGAGVTLMKELPDLMLPEGASASGSGMGGSGDEFSARVLASTPLNRDELIRHFGEQIQGQGWRFDTSWSGTLSSGSVWSKTKSEAETLVGTLKIVQVSDDMFDIRFSVSPINAHAGNEYWISDGAIGSN